MWGASRNPNDPIFELTGGYDIVIEADEDLDSWVLSLTGMTFVDAMT